MKKDNCFRTTEDALQSWDIKTDSLSEKVSGKKCVTSRLTSRVAGK